MKNEKRNRSPKIIFSSVYWNFGNGKWYFFSRHAKTFYQAVNACRKRGGKLAEPKDDRTIKGLVSNINGDVWIGIYWFRSWKWASDHSRATRLNWHNNNNQDTSVRQGHCVYINRSHGGKHFEHSCNNSHRYICEF